MSDPEVQEWVDAVIKPDGAFDPPTNLVEKFVNRVRASILAETDPDMVEIRMPELYTACASLVYGGDDPKSVPKEVMLHCIQNPPDLGMGFLHMDARKRVKNPNTGIRNFCLECQGNDQSGVRQCPSFNCPLWPFRMGTNPFYGRLVGSTGEEETDETEAELLGLDEEDNDANSVA